MTETELAVALLSLKVAGVAAAFSLVPAVALAWVLAKKKFFGKTALEAVVNLPLVLPPVVVGFALLELFGRRGVIGAWLFENFGLRVAFTWEGAALAAAVMGFPLVVRAARLAFEAVDPDLEEAARTLGAGPWRRFATIALPLAAPGVIAGALLGFARALGEFGATIAFVGNQPGETRTLPIAIYTELQRPGGEDAAGRLVIYAILLALAAVAAAEALAAAARRKAAG
ncbi:MAG: molybdate ABC transporter permease subunit [Neomegalonema sp.]|nr:molybdate ABC transporter permease subunit [Neomegalonema sp.]